MPPKTSERRKKGDTNKDDPDKKIIEFEKLYDSCAKKRVANPCVSCLLEYCLSEEKPTMERSGKMDGKASHGQ